MCKPLYKKLRRIPEAIVICLGMLTIPFLPRKAILAIAQGVGGLAFRRVRRLREATLANLDLVYGDTLSDDGKKKIARQAFRTWALTGLDLFWYSIFTRRRLTRWVRYDSSLDQLLQEKSALLVTAHFGSWEIMGLSAAMRGAPLFSVAASLGQPMMDWMVNRMRCATGQQVVPQQGAILGIMQILREGGHTALLMDQNTLPRDGGEFVRFFDRQVPVSKAVSVLARRTRATVVFAYGVAEDDGTCTIHMEFPEAPTQTRGDSGGWTQVVTTALENQIRKRPGQWLWMYRRWKYRPSGEPPEDYPFYAKAAPEGK